MAEIVFSENGKRVVRLSSFYDEDDIIELMAQFTSHRVHLTRMRDDTAPEIFHMNAQDMDTLAEEWLAYRADQTAKAEAYEKEQEDARLAEEEREKAIRQEAYELAKAHGITIEEIGESAWRLLLPDGKKTNRTACGVDALRGHVRVAIKYLNIETQQTITNIVEDAQQVL